MNDLYTAQRAMRAMRKAALQRGVIAVLDVGSSKIACFVLRFDQDLSAAGGSFGALSRQGAFRIIGEKTTRSRGIRFGEIDTMAETERAVLTAIQGAQERAKIRVDHVIACVAGGAPRSYGISGNISLSPSPVQEDDVARVLAACDLPDYGSGREVLHAQPVNFALDHRSGLSDPRGLVGNKLSCDMHLLTIDARVVEHLIYCVKRCNLELAGIASSAYVAGLSSLVEDEQELGAACVDLGGGATTISIFMKKHMLHADSVRLGCDLVTSDISKGLRVPLATAERIKTVYGGVIATGMDDHELIDLEGDSGNWDHDRRNVSRSELIMIIRPRIEEILEEVRARLDLAGFDQLPSQQIILTGGGSQLPGLEQLAPKIMGRHVRIGRPMRVQGQSQPFTGPAFAGAVGLCLFASNPQDEWWDFDVPVERYPTRSLRRVTRWFKDNW